MFQLTKIRDRVYTLKFDDAYELCMAFMRYEEFYESPNPMFQGHSFTWAKYMSWYSKTFGEGSFTYAADWSGFNIPAKIIAQVHQLGIPDPNHYDTLMLGIYHMIEPDAYLIGVSNNGDIERHELTHAMYHLDEAYRNGVHWLLARLGEETLQQMKQALYDTGYAPVTVVDEIQAYVTTGEMSLFDNVTDQEKLNEVRAKLKELHQKHFTAFIPGAATDKAGNVGSNPTENARVESGDE